MTEGLPEAGGREQSLPPVSFSMMIVFCTFPDVGKAREVATGIVSEGHAACVNILPGLESIYRWKGEIQNDSEVLTIFKVATEGFPNLERAILSQHPYETPEIVGITADRVEEKYLSWVLSTP